ncbi:MAG: regulator [Firmicutes bacterium]|nr:regulator [Bacillota bacterium]
MIKLEVPGSAPALGPYSKGIAAANLVFTSGQIGTSAGPELQAQAEAACKAVGAVLEAGGASFANVVKTTCFLADINDFAAFNEVYAKYFISKPARSCFAVKSLPGGALCEIEAIAVVE